MAVPLDPFTVIVSDPVLSWRRVLLSISSVYAYRETGLVRLTVRNLKVRQ
jgi:hypothetical protein